MKVSSPKHRLNTKSQSLSGSSFFNTQNFECWGCTTTFFTKVWNVNKFKELELDTGSLYLAVAEKEVENCIRSEKKAEWEQLRSKGCTKSFLADAVGNFFPRICCDKHKKNKTSESLISSKRSSGVRKCCLCSETYCCYNKTTNKLKFSSESLNRWILEQSVDSPLEKYRKVLDERVNITSTNRGFRTKDHTNATYEQTKQGNHPFTPNEK